jgi:hypothetical protein
VSLAEEIKRTLLEHPEILVEVLTARPQIIYEALARVAPWEKLATKEDLKALEEKVATKDELKELEAKVATKDELKELEAKVATKDELNELKAKVATKDELKALEARMATKDDVRRLEIRIDALGARWGLASEDAFREGVRELLREAGFSVERWTHFDSEGYVYGYPAEVELDVVVRDGRTLLVEITSALKRGDLPIVKRKAELYEKKTGRRADAVMAITIYVHDRNPSLVLAVAQQMGIKIVKPEEAAQP